ncbi:transmembrane protein, putative (macronuclear) [Tetrahymena thermophila SB210]|uniref:Transmembrane protein, putative n=1 Tax=Tetrahymena thermophila (strain SB210) TaxID=312017 RepID=W7X9B6_TETTS|nr:transmembrane protein, putative [Tetrahymena thermophila SB210]EWS72978.1 transmembrane protein, putative [Tetrahymena thermophila SB210]|eukprot:XP_012654485.1 transmembrane protein, putative [Tetrahymena thermophila SB210]
MAYCYNCQKYGHLTRYCYQPVVMVALEQDIMYILALFYTVVIVKEMVTLKAIVFSQKIIF